MEYQQVQVNERRASHPEAGTPVQAPSLMQAPGVAVRRSPFLVKETIDRLQAALTRNGATIYARIDQQAELRVAGLTGPPLELLLFGNPQAGGPLLAAVPLIALDLPLKVIAWQDARHQVWVAYNEASYLESRYGLRPALPNPLDLSPLLTKVLAP